MIPIRNMSRKGGALLLLVALTSLGMQGCGLTPTRSDDGQDAAKAQKIKLIPAPKIKPEYAKKANLVGLTMLAELALQKGELALAVNSYLKAASLSEDPKIAERATRVESVRI